MKSGKGRKKIIKTKWNIELSCIFNLFNDKSCRRNEKKNRLKKKRLKKGMLNSELNYNSSNFKNVLKLKIYTHAHCQHWKRLKEKWSAVNNLIFSILIASSCFKWQAQKVWLLANSIFIINELYYYISSIKKIFCRLYNWILEKYNKRIAKTEKRKI